MTLALRLYGYTTHQQLQQGEYDWRDAPTTWQRPTSISTSARSGSCGSSNPTNWLVRPSTWQSYAPHPAHLSPLFNLGRFASAWRQAAAASRTATWPARIVLDLAVVAIGCIRAAQQCGWSAVEFEPSAIGARGTTEELNPLAIARQPTIANQTYELQIIPTAITPEQIWRFELQNLTPGGQIPAGVTLRLLSKDLQPFSDNEDPACGRVDRLFIEVALTSGEGIV